MMPAQQPQSSERELSLIHEVITKNTSGIIVIPAKSTPDAVAGATSLYLALTKLGKNVSLVSSAKPASDLIGADKFSNKVSTGGDNLVVSFPYRDGAVDKVDYNIQENKFNLIISPKEGSPKLDPKEVEFTYSGGEIEFIITVDATNLASLGEIYQKNQNKFDGKNIINIDRHLVNNNFGTINLVVKSASSTSELVYKVIETMKVELDKDIATNLYAGVVGATNNFSSYTVNADTFEIASKLLRAGAVKKPFRMMGATPRPGMPQAAGGTAGFFQNPFAPRTQAPLPQSSQPVNPSPVEEFDTEDDFDDEIPMPIQQPRPQVQPQQNRPQFTPRSIQNQKPIEQVEKENVNQDTAQETDNENWLKPKVFSESGGLV
jgi:hypothetical protein